MPEPQIAGQASWGQSLREKYIKQEEILEELRKLRIEISQLELHMLIEGISIHEINPVRP